MLQCIILKNAAIDGASSGRANTLAQFRGRRRSRRSRRNCTFQRSSHVSSEISNATIHNSEQMNTSSSPEVYNQISATTSPEKRVISTFHENANVRGRGRKN